MKEDAKDLFWLVLIVCTIFFIIDPKGCVNCANGYIGAVKEVDLK